MLTKLANDSAIDLDKVTSCRINEVSPKKKWWRPKEKWPAKIILTIELSTGHNYTSTWTARSGEQVKEYRAKAEVRLNKVVEALND